MPQTLAGGQTPVMKYPGLGGSSKRIDLDPGRILSLIVGFPHTGKTYLMESHPDAWIIRSDMVSSSNPCPTATVWPELDTQGRCINGSDHFTLTWDLVLEKVELLLKMAKEDKPRPETIVFDSLTSCLELLKEWAPNNLFSSTKGKKWHELDGKMSYSFIYDSFVKTIRTLRNAGYGVCVIGHLKKTRHKDSNGNDMGTTIDLSVTDSFFERMFPYFELIVSTEKTTEIVTTNKPVTVSLPGGKQMVQNKTVKEQRPVYRLGFEIPDLKDRYKGKARPCISIPSTDGWSVFTQAYRDELRLVHDATPTGESP